MILIGFRFDFLCNVRMTHNSVTALIQFYWVWLLFSFVSSSLDCSMVRVRKPIRHPFRLGLVCLHLVRFGLIWSTVEGGMTLNCGYLHPPMTGHSNSRSENPFLIVL